MNTLRATTTGTRWGGEAASPDRRCHRCGIRESELLPFGSGFFANSAHAVERLIERTRWATDDNLTPEEFSRLPLELKRDYLEAIHTVEVTSECRNCYLALQPQSREGYRAPRLPYWL